VETFITKPEFLKLHHGEQSAARRQLTTMLNLASIYRERIVIWDATKTMNEKPNTPETPDSEPDNSRCDLICSPHPLLDARRDACAWKEDEDGMPNTECGESYYYEDGWESHVRYCQGCGGVVWIPRDNTQNKNDSPAATGTDE
jgi:hypothetical protein